MDLIERYVVEVARHLPPGSDVPDELRSLLSDALEQRAAAAGRAPDDVMASEVLREFGDPEVVSARYLPSRYLIGPELYPLYQSIALGIIAVSLAIRLIVVTFRLLVDQHVPQLPSFSAAAWDYIVTTFVLLGVLTVVFFALDRLLPSIRATAWDPRDLPPTADESVAADVRRGAEISLWELTIGLIVLNVFPQWIGVPFGLEYRWSIASPSELAIPLPVALLNAYGFGALVLNVMLWRFATWTRPLRWMQFLVGLAGLAVVLTMLTGAAPPSAAEYYGLARVVRGVLWVILFWQLWTAGSRVWRLMQRVSAARNVAAGVLCVVLFVATPSRELFAQQAFYAHDNYTQYELLDPTSNQFAITYFVTERRPGATVLLNQTRSGSAGSDISVFDPQTGKPLKFDYVSGAELAKDGTPGRFDPAEHYIRAQLPRPVPNGGEGRVKILKTYKDEKSYFKDGEDIVFRRSLGIARNSIVLPKDYRLVSSNVSSQILTLPDGRLKISFEHAHGYAADVTIRARKAAAPVVNPAPANERSFDFSKSLVDLGPPDTHTYKLTSEFLWTRVGSSVSLEESAADVAVTDVDTGQVLKHSSKGKSVVAELMTPIADGGQSARLRVVRTISDPTYRLEGGLLFWEGVINEPRCTILLPAEWDVGSISVMSTVAAQSDGRMAIQIYNGNPGALPVSIRAVKR